MPLDPDIKAVLDLLAAFGAPPLSEGDAQTARQNFRFLAVDGRNSEDVVPVADVADVKLDGPAGPMAARIYRPGGQPPYPTVAFFHGGGFVIGDIDTHDNQCRWICRETGSVVVSFDYRLAPEHPWPAAVDDAVAATRWAADNIERLGGDPARLAVAGDSAGGNLAAVVAQQLRDAGGPPLAGQLLIYPVVDMRVDSPQRYPSRIDNAEGYFLTAADMAWFHSNYAATADPADPRLSPILGRVDSLPPAVVVTAEYDPLRDEAEAYAAALRDAGVPVRLRRYDGMIHGFFDMGAMSAAAKQAVLETCREFAAVLHPE